MLLTITSTSPPATDLGFLLHKNPASVRSLEIPSGTAHVFYPEAGPARCTAALLCEVDPVALVRRSRGGPFPLAAYVNDRPYAASSLLSVALRKMFGTALRGQSRERPDLPGQPMDLSAWLPVLPCRGGEGLLRQLFEPLGYRVEASPVPLDGAFPGWGDSPYFDVRVSARCHVRDLLGHLYVLLPVLDDDKHYWVTRDEVGKLAASAGEWLAGHPERDLIIRRYLRHQPVLVQEAASCLLGEEAAGVGAAVPGILPEDGAAGEAPTANDAAATASGKATTSGEAASGEATAGGAQAPAPLRETRAAAVAGVLRAAGARRVLDLGCGDGRLLEVLLRDPQFTEVVGVDAAVPALQRAARRLHLDELAPRQAGRIRLLQSALTYRDRRLAGYDAAVLMEVIEHVDPGRLGALEEAVFGEAAPSLVVVTTPNAEYNACFPRLAAGEFRHPDHRFEWDRATFRDWALAVAGRHAYAAEFLPVGEKYPRLGPPTQMAVLRR